MRILVYLALVALLVLAPVVSANQKSLQPQEEQDLDTIPHSTETDTPGSENTVKEVEDERDTVQFGQGNPSHITPIIHPDNGDKLTGNMSESSTSEQETVREPSATCDEDAKSDFFRAAIDSPFYLTQKSCLNFLRGNGRCTKECDDAARLLVEQVQNSTIYQECVAKDAGAQMVLSKLKEGQCGQVAIPVDKNDREHLDMAYDSNGRPITFSGLPDKQAGRNLGHSLSHPIKSLKEWQDKMAPPPPPAPTPVNNDNDTQVEDPCNPNPCHKGYSCEADPKRCITAPCPQFKCVLVDSTFTYNAAGQEIPALNRSLIGEPLDTNLTNHNLPPTKTESQACLGRFGPFQQVRDGCRAFVSFKIKPFKCPWACKSALTSFKTAVDGSPLVRKCIHLAEVKHYIKDLADTVCSVKKLGLTEANPQAQGIEGLTDLEPSDPLYQMNNPAGRLPPPRFDTLKTEDNEESSSSSSEESSEESSEGSNASPEETEESLQEQINRQLAPVTVGRGEEEDRPSSSGLSANGLEGQTVINGTDANRQGVDSEGFCTGDPGVPVYGDDGEPVYCKPRPPPVHMDHAGNVIYDQGVAPQYSYVPKVQPDGSVDYSPEQPQRESNLDLTRLPPENPKDDIANEPDEFVDPETAKLMAQQKKDDAARKDAHLAREHQDKIDKENAKKNIVDLKPKPVKSSNQGGQQQTQQPPINPTLPAQDEQVLEQILGPSSPTEQHQANAIPVQGSEEIPQIPEVNPAKEQAAAEAKKQEQKDQQQQQTAAPLSDSTHGVDISVDANDLVRFKDLFSHKLVVLSKSGYKDEEKNIRLLIKYNGDVNEVVADLEGMNRGAVSEDFLTPAQMDYIRELQHAKNAAEAQAAAKEKKKSGANPNALPSNEVNESQEIQTKMQTEKKEEVRATETAYKASLEKASKEQEQIQTSAPNQDGSGIAQLPSNKNELVQSQTSLPSSPPNAQSQRVNEQQLAKKDSLQSEVPTKVRGGSSVLPGVTDQPSPAAVKQQTNVNPNEDTQIQQVSIGARNPKPRSTQEEQAEENDKENEQKEKEKEAMTDKKMPPRPKKNKNGKKKTESKLPSWASQPAVDILKEGFKAHTQPSL